MRRHFYEEVVIEEEAGMAKKPVTSEEVKLFIQDNLTFINRSAGCIDYVDKNGCNMEEGFSKDPYEAINKAILAERKNVLVVY